MKALIIDDERGVLELYKEGFKSSGIETIAASSGEEGIEFARAQKPDVILLDIIMPRMNGLDVLKMIKSDQDIKDIPVYLLTNLPEECSGGKTKDLGAKGYFVKAEYEPKTIAQKILAESHNVLPGGK